MPLPAKLSRHAQFNQCLGLDVKYLPRWKLGQKIKALIPFHDRETSELLRKLVEDHWIRWAGPPSEDIMDHGPSPNHVG